MAVIKIKAPSKSYQAVIERGIFQDIAKEIKKAYHGQRLFVLTDENLWQSYGRELEKKLFAEGFSVHIHVLKPGESSKALSCFEKICEDFIRNNISREDCVVAFGGGVVGDVAGFVASVLNRGIRYINIPTSIIAQTDSSVGGKTGLNLAAGKNLIGSFYHPEKVIIDPDFIGSLPLKYVRDGMAEVIKYALIKDAHLFDLLQEKDLETIKSSMEEIIHRCLMIKADLVQTDEKDQGERMLLNFGHTLGHALEAYTSYEGYSHGEAVAVGMSIVTKNSEKIGLTQKGSHDKIVNILKRYQLPYETREENQDRLIALIGSDKKSAGHTIQIALLQCVGESFLKRIDKAEVKDFFSLT